MLPLVSEVILVQKPFPDPELEIRQADSIGVVVKNRSANIVHTKVLAVDAETIEMEVTPAESQLQCIVKISDTLVGTKQQSAPDQWANAT